MLSGVERAPASLTELRRAGRRSQRLPVFCFWRSSRFCRWNACPGRGDPRVAPDVSRGIAVDARQAL